MWRRLRIHAVALAIITCIAPACAQDVQQADESAQPADASQKAEDTAPSPRNILPYFEHGFASDAEIRAAVGHITYRMDQCAVVIEYAPATDSRIASAIVSRLPADIEQQPAIIDAILRKTAQFAWRECPFPFANLDNQTTGDFHYDLQQVNIFGPDGLVASASLGGSGAFGSGDDIFNSSKRGYAWAGYHNGIAERQVQAGQQQAAVQWQRGMDENRRQTNELFGNVWKVMKLIVALVFAGWLFTMREPILRFYYFHFHPHPAAPLVRSLIASGGNTQDIARSFAEVLGEVPPASRILHAVRLEQTDLLVGDIRNANAAREREFARQARNREIAAYESEAFYSAQTAMALAVEALGLSKTAYAKASELRRSRP